MRLPSQQYCWLWLLLSLAPNLLASTPPTPNPPTPPTPPAPPAPPTHTPPTPTPLFVQKRDGTTEPIKFDKISARLASLSTAGRDANLPALSRHVDISSVAQRVVSGIYAGVTTSELDNLAAETAAYMSVSHPDYGRLAARIAVSNLHKGTDGSFVQTLRRLHEAKDGKAGGRAVGFVDPS
ncbi:hypothetical protein TeGR_g14490, partial [Tetraparma gracilis]